MDQVKGRKDRGVLCERVSDGNDGKKDMTVLEICKKLHLSTMKK
jgi:hypothetical protein